MENQDYSQATVIRTKEELGEAIKNNVNFIIIEGDLANQTFKVKAAGKVAWAIAIGGITVAVASIVLAKTAKIEPQSHPVGSAISFTGAAGGTAVTALALGKTALAAIGIAAAAGGVGVLTTLRDKYKIVEHKDKQLLLERK